MPTIAVAPSVTAANDPVHGAAGLPPVRVLLAALLWLTARQQDQPTPATLRAIALQMQRLAVHPDASAEDRLAGLRLACRSYHDALLWLGDCGNAAH